MTRSIMQDGKIIRVPYARTKAAQRARNREKWAAWWNAENGSHKEKKKASNSKALAAIIARYAPK